MQRAVELARRGWGRVEPNPMVGCLIVRDEQVVGEGWHREFGGPHAEIEALRQAGEQARGATCIVTLEPCCHQGKTPPCTDALIEAGIRHVAIGCLDPNPQVHGKGARRLQEAGVEVTIGPAATECEGLIAPFAKLVRTGTPWVLAKWAMTLDGHVATASGDARWISSEASRAIVHRLRGAMDAIVVGIGTVLADDCLLTARPPGPRLATRVVLDRRARLPLTSQLVQTSQDVPVLVAVGPEADRDRVEALRRASCEVWQSRTGDPSALWLELLAEMGKRQWTQILVEGGPRVLGTCFDIGTVDEVHVFVAPKIAGGANAPGAVGGWGAKQMADARQLSQCRWQEVDGDLYLTGRMTW